MKKGKARRPGWPVAPPKVGGRTVSVTARHLFLPNYYTIAIKLFPNPRPPHPKRQPPTPKSGLCTPTPVPPHPKARRASPKHQKLSPKPHRRVIVMLWRHFLVFYQEIFAPCRILRCNSFCVAGSGRPWLAQVSNAVVAGFTPVGLQRSTFRLRRRGGLCVPAC